MISALDAPRVQIVDGTSSGQILIEEGVPETVRAELESMGHNTPIILSGWDRLGFGVGQIIIRNPENGVLCAGSDPRLDGLAICW